MEDGFCPKCSSNEVFIDNGRTVSTYRLGDVMFTDYFCLTCGYAESYLFQKDRNKARQLDIEQENMKKRKKRKNDAE